MDKKWIVTNAPREWDGPLVSLLSTLPGQEMYEMGETIADIGEMERGEIEYV